MSRTTTPSRRLVPPPGGWTLQEALEALCPDAVRLYREGGDALDAVLRAELGNWADLLDPWPEGYLRKQLYQALCEREDLELTGFDLTQGASAHCSRMPHALLVAAGLDKRPADSGYAIYIELLLEVDRVGISYSFPEMRPNLPSDVELVGARVKLVDCAVAAAMPSSQAHLLPLSGGETSFTQSCPTDAEIGRWVKRRVEDWPAGEPPPSSLACLEAARLHFRYDIPRDRFRTIRRLNAPSGWIKPGPRDKRKPPN